jgi:hypothetical protein
MTITHNKRIVASSMPTHQVSFNVLHQLIQRYLTNNLMVHKYYKIRDDLQGTMYIYLPNNGRLEVKY